MFKVKGLGKRLVFVRYKLWAIVCKAVERDAVACKVGLSDVDDGG